jgi:hypothetical protein
MKYAKEQVQRASRSLGYYGTYKEAIEQALKYERRRQRNKQQLAEDEIILELEARFPECTKEIGIFCPKCGNYDDGWSVVSNSVGRALLYVVCQQCKGRGRLFAAEAAVGKITSGPGGPIAGSLPQQTGGTP